MNKKILIGSMALSLALAFPLSAFAETGSGDVGDLRPPQTETNTELKQQHLDEMEQVREANKEKLAGLKLQMCEHRQTEITKNIAQANAQAQKHLDTFTKIADRVVAFATDKNRKPANFDALVADISTKKAAAQAAIDAAKTASFDCSSDAPKGQIIAFRGTLKTMRDALKAYRTSIKNLIVAIKATPAPTTSTEGATQ